MKISRAVEKCLKTGKYMTLPEWKGLAKIKPTDEIGNCILMDADGSNPSKLGWQPSAKQLLRKDWMLTE